MQNFNCTPATELYMKEINRLVDSDDRIAAQILLYLKKHPQAKDTLEGITEWWLEKQLIDQSVESVARGVSQLCARGLLREEKIMGKNSFYKLNTVF
jgi:hypothetical protein